MSTGFTDVGQEARSDARLRAALDGLAALGPMNLLVVHERVPHFDASGADGRLLRILETVRAAGHAVTFIGRAGGEAGRHRRRLEELGIRVLAPDPGRLRWYADVPAPPVDLAALVVSGSFDAAILFTWFWSGISVAEQYLPELRRHAPATFVIVLSDDVHWFRQERLARLTGRRVDLERSRGLRAKEREIYGRADLVLTITEEDRARILDELPEICVQTLRHGCPSRAAPCPGFEDREGLLFVGGGENLANLMAVQWFLTEVWPALRRRVPGLRFRIVGSPPPGGWPGAAGFTDIETVGHVGTLDPYLAAARVFVSPITFATGLNTKNVVALAAGLPLVTTRVGAEGMHLAGDEVARVRDDAAAFATAVAALYSQRATWEAASSRSLEHAKRHFGLGVLAGDLRRVLTLVRSLRPRDPAGGAPLTALQVEALWPRILDEPASRRLSARFAAHVRLARRFLDGGRIDEALRELRYLLVCCPAPVDWVGFAPVYFSLGLVYLRAGQRDEAWASLEEALRLDPSHRRTRQLLRRLRRRRAGRRRWLFWSGGPERIVR